MECGNCFCVYWDNENCILQKISLDIQGRCNECIYINIDKDTLKNERLKILHRFEEQYLEWEKRDDLATQTPTVYNP